MKTTKKTAQIGLIVLAISIITILHYSSAHGTVRGHIIHRELYFIPILLGSLWFGLKGGLATSLTISLVYAPYVVVDGETRRDLWPVFFQIMMFNVVAVLVGFLVERGKRQQEKMFAMEKSAALGRAAKAVGHEIQELFEALKTIADRPEASEQGELNRGLNKELARLEQLVEILSVPKTTGNLKLFSHDINDIIRERVKRYRVPANKKGVMIHTDLDAEGCPSWVDAETIGRVLDQIIENALEVSTPGKAIHVRSTRRLDQCEVRIADEGPGIKPEHLPKIFKPFFSTKEKGDGLALSSSQKILRDMGGEIQVESRFGSGATFTVIVPREYSTPLSKGPHR
jgi:signal transduction histidine kinase